MSVHQTIYTSIWLLIYHKLLFSNIFIFETWSVRQQCWILFLLVPKLYIWNLIVKIVKFRDDASMHITWSCIQEFLPGYCQHATNPCEKMTQEECNSLIMLLGRNTILTSKLAESGRITLNRDSPSFLEELDSALKLMR